jgi:hypothetical protein
MEKRKYTASEARARKAREIRINGKIPVYLTAVAVIIGPIIEPALEPDAAMAKRRRL